MKFSSTLTLTLLTFAALSVAPAQSSFWDWRPSWWPDSSVPTSPFWDGLKTTFANDGVFSNLFNTTGYQGIPRTLSDALNKGWVSISNTCDQDNNGQFFGFRYTAQYDPSVAVIFDVNGIVAGIQMNINKTQAKSSSSNTYQFDTITMFQSTTINGVAYYTLTAYFVDPTTICSSGRSSNDFTAQGTGTQLVFQNGPTPDTLIEAPQSRSDALDEGWSDNKCFGGMGVHNWYQQETYDQDNCNTVRPVFLLYTKEDDDQGLLLGFGFQFIGTCFARRFEQPPSFAIKMIVGSSVSQCLIDKANDPNVGVTTMHVFLISNPLSQTCL